MVEGDQRNRSRGDGEDVIHRFGSFHCFLKPPKKYLSEIEQCHRKAGLPVKNGEKKRKKWVVKKWQQGGYVGGLGSKLPATENFCIFYLKK